jgi:hypothetical protein
LKDKADLSSAEKCHLIIRHLRYDPLTHQNISRAWTIQPAHEMQQRALTGPARSHDRRELTLRNIDGNSG